MKKFSNNNTITDGGSTALLLGGQRSISLEYQIKPPPLYHIWYSSNWNDARYTLWSSRYILSSTPIFTAHFTSNNFFLSSRDHQLPCQLGLIWYATWLECHKSHLRIWQGGGWPRILLSSPHERVFMGLQVLLLLLCSVLLQVLLLLVCHCGCKSCSVIAGQVLLLPLCRCRVQNQTFLSHSVSFAHTPAVSGKIYIWFCHRIWKIYYLMYQQNITDDKRYITWCTSEI